MTLLVRLAATFGRWRPDPVERAADDRSDLVSDAEVLELAMDPAVDACDAAAHAARTAVDAVLLLILYVILIGAAVAGVLALTAGN